MSDEPECSYSAALTVDPSAPQISAPQGSAVDRCAEAWKRAHDLASLVPKKQRHEEEYDRFVNGESARAFRDAMPPLIGFENIQEYIACVAYAELHEIFTYPERQRLFECARFALSVIRPEPKSRKSQ